MNAFEAEMIFEVKKKNSLTDLQNSYNKIYKKGGFTGGREYFLAMIKFLRPKKDKNRKLLDVGCGDGRFFKYLRPYAQLYGVDISERAINRANSCFPYANFHLGSADNLPYPDNEFDHITYLGTLEHFLDMEKSLDEAKRVLKDEGTCLFLVPVLFFAGNILSVTVKGDIPVMQDLDRFSTFYGWKRFFEKNGFRVIRTYKYNIKMPMGLKYLDWKWPFKLIYNLSRPFIPFHLSWHFAFIVKKA